MRDTSIKDRKVIENWPHGSCSSTSVNDGNIEKVRDSVRENLRFGIRKIREETELRTR